MKKIYLVTVVLLAIFITACQKDNKDNSESGDNNSAVSTDGVWQFTSQEGFYKGVSQGKTEDPNQLQCLEKSKIIFQGKECTYQEYILMSNGCVKQEVNGYYKLTDKELEITKGNTVKRYEIHRKTNQEIVVKQGNPNEPGAYFLDTYVKK